MADRFCVSIANCKLDGDKATLGFVVANAALGSEKETLVFLSADGVWAAVEGEVDNVNEGEPFAPLKDLVTKFVNGGGTIYVCSPCMKKRGVTADTLVKGAQEVGGAALIEWLTPGTVTMCY